MTTSNPAADALRSAQGEAAENALLPDYGVVNVRLALPSGQTLEGVFEYRLPLSFNAGQRIGVEAARLRGGKPPEALDEQTATMAWVAAYVLVAVTRRPPWADGDRLLELPGGAELLSRVAEVVRKHENTFRQRIRIE